MKKTLEVLLILIMGFTSESKLHAQASFSDLENNKITYPSPTAASLGKYGEYPLNLYNGLVDIGQDIITVKSGHLTLNVSLSYHAGGNRPSDIPGWVGLGFSLNAGGVITRVIKDLPDDQDGGFYSYNTTVKDLWTNHLTQFFDDYNNGAIDPRSDLYQFNFCGKTGEFVFDWDRQIHFKQQVPFKIQELNGPGGFAGFKVTTDDGTIYTFDQAEHSQQNALTINPPVSSWYLSKIENLSGDKIVLKYTAPLGKFRYNQYSTRKEAAGTVSISGVELVPGPIVNLSTSKNEVIYLDEIDFNNGKLTFGKSKRTDPYYIPSEITSSNAEEKKLDLITLKDNGNSIIKQWKFEYFENSSERLKLKNLIVQSSNQTDIQKYSFEYNSLKLPLPLPGPNPANPYLSNDVDYWGYYNGATNGENRIPKMYMSEFDQYIGDADRSVNPSFVQAEMLEKITYPTGGYSAFQYESNDYSNQGASFAAAQNPLTESSTPPEVYGFEYDRDNGGFDVDPASLSFTLTGPTHINVKYSCGADGPNHEWANPGINYEYDYTMQAGTHTVQGILNTGLLTGTNSANITKAHAFVTVYKIGPLIAINAKPGPGLRIKSIETNDGIISTTRSFEYKQDNPQNPSLSSGYLSVFPAFYAPLQSVLVNTEGYYAASEPINDIGDGAPIGYSRVVERFQDNSSIIHNYTTYSDYPDEIMPFLNGFSDSKLAHMSSMDFMRGLENHTSYHNADGVLLKDITIGYTVLPESVTDVQSIDLKSTVQIMAAPGSSVNVVNFPLSSLFYVHSCFLYNSTSTERTFDKNGQNQIVTTINKYYDNVKHLQPTRIETAASDGSIITTATSFPDDFAAGTPFIDYLQANHLTSFPIEQIIYKQKGGVNNIISGNIIEYKTEGAGLPEKLFKLETASPISQGSFKFSNRLAGVLPPSSVPSLYSADTHYQLVLSYTQYDNKGNPLESLTRNGIKTSYLWGYKQEFPVAQIVGADYSTASGKIIHPSILDNPISDGELTGELSTLRTIPNAFVTTYTYHPLSGITSQTDLNGRTTYYEYDLFNRLFTVRDQDHNILKKLCYNYFGQTEHCNIYQSAAINADYYSQNCSSGESPDAYHISVPKGMFGSYVDQPTADQLAQEYAQNLANQHGSCSILNVSVYSENNHGIEVTVQLHNSLGQNYSITVDPHGNGTLDVPPGTYDITFTPAGSGWYNYSAGCGYYDAGPGALTIYSVSINSGCNSIGID